MIELQILLNHDMFNMYASSKSTCPCAEGAQISLTQRSPNSLEILLSQKQTYLAQLTHNT